MRNLNTTLRGQTLMISGFVIEGERTITTTPDVMTDSDYMVASVLGTPGAVAITLPDAGIGFITQIRDGAGDAGTHNITITPPAGQTIEGNASVVINVNRGALTLRRYSATDWAIIGRTFATTGGGAVVPSGVTFTQTYSTSSTTVPADTSHAITDSTGGTPSTTALALLASSVTGVDGTGSNAASKANVDSALVIIKNSLSTLAAELALCKADALATKKALNAVIDALQLSALAG